MTMMCTVYSPSWNTVSPLYSYIFMTEGHIVPSLALLQPPHHMLCVTDPQCSEDQEQLQMEN